MGSGRLRTYHTNKVSTIITKLDEKHTVRTHNEKIRKRVEDFEQIGYKVLITDVSTSIGGDHIATTVVMVKTKELKKLSKKQS